MFDRICAAVPRIHEWTKTDQAIPVSDVIGFGNMDCFWRKSIADGQTQVRNFFFLGDSAVRTNPKFGRGCTWSTVAAHALAEIVSAENDPDRRLKAYEEMLWQNFRNDWLTTLDLERAARKKFDALLGHRRASLLERLRTIVESHVMTRAMVIDPNVQRAIMRGFHGFDGMSDWSRDPEIWLRILKTGFASKNQREITRQFSTRPSRDELKTMAQT